MFTFLYYSTKTNLRQSKDTRYLIQETIILSQFTDYVQDSLAYKLFTDNNRDIKHIKKHIIDLESKNI
jgi:hypothetical protein